MIDFRALADAALRDAEVLVPRWLPHGRAGGSGRNEWVAANPQRSDSTGGGAFSVNLRTGEWGDFKIDVKGRDLISLYKYLFNHENMGVAARALATEIGYALDGPAALPRSNTAPAPREPSPAPPRADAADGELLTPAPPDAPAWQPLLDHRQLGRAAASWVYRDFAGAILMVVIRWNDPARPGAKEIRPFTCWRSPAGVVQWRSKGLPVPRPLYRLDELARHRAATVVVCEGEKAADAAQELLGDGYVATTSPNGATNAAKADWSPLADRKVLIWPDHDEPGIRFASDVRRLAIDAGATTVQVLSFGWVAQVLAMIAQGAA